MEKTCRGRKTMSNTILKTKIMAFGYCQVPYNTYNFVIGKMSNDRKLMSDAILKSKMVASGDRNNRNLGLQKGHWTLILFSSTHRPGL